MSKQAIPSDGESPATESQPLIPVTVKAGNDDNDGGGGEESTAATKASETIAEDAIDTLKIGFPIFISSISWIGVSALISASTIAKLSFPFFEDQHR